MRASIDPDEFHTVLRGLEGRGMLPALAFSFDRRKCEYLAGQHVGLDHALLCTLSFSVTVTHLCMQGPDMQSVQTKSAGVNSWKVMQVR